MIDHAMIRVKDLKKSRAFYTAALEPLGYRPAHEFPGAIGFASGEKADFWVAQDTPTTTAAHVAFTCRDRKVVDAFHAAALKSGGKDNGAPGIRADYSPNYYAAFVYDPDGNNIETVCHEPQK
jgi:catechol 2,3-dioxygenase-like lactoylglutathione lyase family enzyme